MNVWLDIAHDSFQFVGIVAFAISGAMLGVQKRMDIVGLMGLAVITATGGGMLRDLLIGAVPVAALTEWWMLLTAIGGAVVVFVLHRYMERLNKPVLFFDAIGLGVFCVEGTRKALELDVNPVAAATVGMLTGIGGGVIRDMLANDIPAVFRRESRLYLVPALLGAAGTATVISLGIGTWWVLALIAAAVVVMRLLSEFLGWRAPALKTEVLRVIGREG